MKISRYSRCLILILVLVLLIIPDFLLSWVSAAVAPDFAQERVAIMEFQGTENGLAVMSLKNPGPVRLLLKRGRGEWKNPRSELVIKNFWGGTVAAIRTSVQVEGGAIRLDIRHEQPECGWFACHVTLRDDDGEWRVSRVLDDGMGKPDIEQFVWPMYAIVPEPRPRNEIADCPVAVDTLVATSNKNIPDDRQLELAHLLGVKWIRERIAWGWIEPESGKQDWDGSTRGGNQFRHGGRVRDIASWCQEKGIAILEVFHGIPAWAAEADNAPFKTFPEDLRTFYRWLKDTAGVLSPAVAAWSIWNEQDIGFFCEEGPDEYAAFLKTGALALRDAPGRPQVLPGSFARDPRVGGYMDTLSANAVSPYFDIYDFHTYAPLSGRRFEGTTGIHLELAEKANKTEAWLTETAFGFTRGKPPARAASREEQVRYLVGSYSLAFSMGVKRAFWHALRPAAPMAAHQYGMINANLEPFPVYQAMAVMAHTLGNGHYMGKLATADNVPVHLYKDGKTEVALVHSDRQTTTIGPVSSATTAIDVMGGVLEIRTMGGGGADLAEVSNHGWPFYLRNTAWAGRITSPPPPAVRAAASPDRRDRDRDRDTPSGVVIRVKYLQENVSFDPGKKERNWDGVASNWAPRGYVFTPGEKINARIEIYNFSPTPASGPVVSSGPDGMRVEPARLHYTVQPGDRAILDVAITLSGTGGEKGGNIKFEARNHPPGGQREDVMDVSVSKWLPRTRE
ncbi:MAG: hypothetical protein LBK99_18045 [Opitutaceae bacterium]|jgi:hypothetical protein|nr:hypothetical protein [Opitutaceae bacterium]